MIKTRYKKGFSAIWIFYFLIAFEIVYMISPFAIYYYSLYGKGLSFLNDTPVTSWLTAFFLPHFAKTSSFILNICKDIGWSLAITGFLAFCIGAGQIYYSKFAKKQAVTGGIYNCIRHPQYVSLSICSFGLLLVWPRYLVLIMFISMLFVYYFLARAEEQECEGKFGGSYIEYKNSTFMFLPLPFKLAPLLPRSGVKRIAAILSLYLIAVAFSIGTAQLLKKFSISHLYTAYSENAATISLAKIDKEHFKKIIQIALSDDDVQKRLHEATRFEKAKFLNYVLPAEWFCPDIPMNDEQGIGEHYMPDNYDANRYKILFMHAAAKPNGTGSEGKEILSNTMKRTPIMEVEVSLSENKVSRIESPPATVRWGDIPTPLF